LEKQIILAEFLSSGTYNQMLQPNCCPQREEIKDLKEVEISVVSTQMDFERLEPQWNNLLNRSTCDNPFLTFEWQYTWWKKFGKGKQLQILIARQNDQILGIAPLMQRRVGPFKVIEFIGTGLSDYLGFIVDRDCPALMKDILEFMHKERRSWDLINLSDITQIDFLKECIRGCLPFRISERLYEISPFITITLPWDEYLKGKSKSSMKHIKYNLSKVEKSGEVELVVLRDTKITGEQLAKVIWQIENNSWKQEAGTAHFADKIRREFLADIFNKFEKKGWLDAMLLKIDGDFVAYSIVYCYGPKSYNYEVGYNQAHPGAGTYLTCHHVKRAFDQGLVEYDFLRGNESYKLRWTKTHRNQYQVVASKRHSPMSFLGLIMLFKLRWWLSSYARMHQLILAYKMVKNKLMNPLKPSLHFKAGAE
jgi:CelD/BcsL family acetyltransferase involved in cellulose biosynthesis